jgi:secondary thiamine-phosphate synthase enzyme
MATKWLQQTITLPAHKRGFHLVTHHVLRSLPELDAFRVGLLNLFLQHTSASLTLNENASPEVPLDLESAMNAIAPEDVLYQHALEGPDDMPAHIKSSLLGPSLTIPIRSGHLALGTWQGIFLCEHRNHGGRRQLLATLQGEV